MNSVLLKVNYHEETLAAPQGGKLHLVSLTYQPPYAWRKVAWREMVKLAGPQTPIHSQIHSMGTYYPPKFGVGRECEVVLLQHPSWNYDQSKTWASATGFLETTQPMRVLAVSINKPGLNVQLGLPVLEILATSPFTRGGKKILLGVKWENLDREVFSKISTDQERRLPCCYAFAPIGQESA